MADNLWQLHASCCFFTKASALMMTVPMEIDGDIADGLGVHGQALRLQSNKLSEQMDELLHSVKERSRT